MRAAIITSSDSGYAGKREDVSGPVIAEIDLPKKIVRTGYSHIAFSVGSVEIVDALTAELKADGYEVISGPRTTGDGYYESCIVAVEDNQIEITV